MNLCIAYVYLLILIIVGCVKCADKPNQLSNDKQSSKKDRDTNNKDNKPLRLVEYGDNEDSDPLKLVEYSDSDEEEDFENFEVTETRDEHEGIDTAESQATERPELQKQEPKSPETTEQLQPKDDKTVDKSDQDLLKQKGFSQPTQPEPENMVPGETPKYYLFSAIPDQNGQHKLIPITYLEYIPPVQQPVQYYLPQQTMPMVGPYLTVPGAQYEFYGPEQPIIYYAPTYQDQQFYGPPLAGNEFQHQFYGPPNYYPEQPVPDQSKGDKQDQPPSQQPSESDKPEEQSGEPGEEGAVGGAEDDEDNGSEGGDEEDNFDVTETIGQTQDSEGDKKEAYCKEIKFFKINDKGKLDLMNEEECSIEYSSKNLVRYLLKGNLEVLMCNDDVVYTHAHLTQYSITITYDKIPNTFIIEFPDFFLVVFLVRGSWRLQKRRRPDLKLFKEDVTGKEIEMTSEDYKIRLSSRRSFKIIIMKNVHCTKVIVNNLVAWKKTDDDTDLCGFGLTSGNYIVFFFRGYIRVLVVKNGRYKLCYTKPNRKYL